jgi:hypothetical protein
MSLSLPWGLHTPHVRLVARLTGKGGGSSGVHPGPFPPPNLERHV